jgi:restriction endonuclease S subunit
MRKGEIEGRLDPNFVHLSKVLKEIFEHSNYDLVNFGKCIDYIQYGISSLANTEQRGVPIIRMVNLKGDEWNFSNLKHIELSEKDLKTYKVIDGDLLFNRTNSKELVGKCGVFREQGDWVFASYLIRVRVDTNLLLPEFASFFLGSTVGRMQIDCLSRQIIGMTNINAEEIKLIKIPVPPIEVQKQIIKKFEAIHTSKRAKESESVSLLNGINTYLLERLGIETPTTTETKRTFFTRASQLSGRRFDPFYHRTEFEEFENALANSRYDLKKIDSLCFDVRGVTYTAADEAVEGKKILRANNINLRTNELDLSDIRFIRADFEISSEQLLRKNDIFMCAASGSKEHSGKVAFIEQETDFYFGGFMMVLRSLGGVVPRYLFEILASTIFRKFLMKILGGTNINNLNFSMFKSYKIPLPPLEVQEEIVAHIH